MAAPETMQQGDALLVVDVQRDFCAGGRLEVPGGDDVVPVLNRWLAAAERAGVPVFLSRDWHPGSHPSFHEHGGGWPRHCVQDTPGAAFHPELRVPPAVHVVTKGMRLDQDQHSAFDETGLGAALHRLHVRRLFVGGLAEDVCVRASVLDALARGFQVVLVPGGTRPVTADTGRAARQEMRAAGATLEEPAP
jgi:nicotinamidase/pyrazinamidase